VKSRRPRVTAEVARDHVTQVVTQSEPVLPSGEGGLVRVRIDLAYDGTEFSGWARQPGRRTVQGELEAALCRVLRLPSVQITVAGRTDAGVHAVGQVAHVDLPGAVPDRLLRRLNGVLPPDVRLQAVCIAPDGFDARFSALARRYEYRICDGTGNPLRRRETLWWPRRLNVSLMHLAAQRLLGEHDFAAYCKRREGATTVRWLLRLDVSRDGDLVTLTVEADAFCHSMVRALVGGLIAVGEGRRPVEWPAQVLVGRERNPGGQVVPAHGLTLVEVTYPAETELAARATQTRRLRVSAD
jgi:tRNA pseudouridine38-40 synthase